MESIPLTSFPVESLFLGINLNRNALFKHRNWEAKSIALITVSVCFLNFYQAGLYFKRFLFLKSKFMHRKGLRPLLVRTSLRTVIQRYITQVTITNARMVVFGHTCSVDRDPCLFIFCLFILSRTAIRIQYAFSISFVMQNVHINVDTYDVINALVPESNMNHLRLR